MQIHRFPSRLSGVAVLSVALALGGLSMPMAQAMEQTRPPADFLLEMIDPSLCMVPPADVSDAELIAALDSDDPEMVSSIDGIWQQGSGSQVAGSGYFNTSSNGLVAGLSLVLRDPDDQLRYLCLALARHVDTHITEGEAALVGPEVMESGAVPEGDTFLVVALLGDREGGRFVAADELITDHGTLSLERVDEETLAGSLALDGYLENQATQDRVSLELELTELWHYGAMNVVDWSHEP